MSRTALSVGWANGLALAAAITLSLLGGLDRTARDATAVSAEPTITTVRIVALPGGGQGVPDTGGHVVPLRRYQRIVSTSMLADRLLADLSEPDRVLAYSTASARNSAWAWRFAGKPHVDGLGALEPLIALKPDLVLMNSFGADGRSEKLRAAGIEVFDLGEMHGLRTLLPMAELVATLLGEPDRGRRYAEAFRTRIGRVAAPLGDRPRRRALYLAVIGGHIYGGTRGTSYHDVLTHAGLIDVAAERYKGWPEYASEQIAALAPELIVTKDGLSGALCAHPGLQTLEACRLPGRVLTLPAGLVDEPGPAMLDAAELLFRKAYPRQ